MKGSRLLICVGNDTWDIIYNLLLRMGKFGEIFGLGYHICKKYIYIYWIIGLFMYYLFAMDNALYVDRWIGR